jgi:hypothetical protein
LQGNWDDDEGEKLQFVKIIKMFAFDIVEVLWQSKNLLKD